MDVFCDAREVLGRFERYVIDLRRLLVFHGLACGAAENFGDLALKLEESRALRLDLPALLRNIRDLEQEQMTADEMLTVVALASGGEELVDGRAGSAGLTRTVGMLQMMLAGVGTWAETGGPDRAAKAVTGEANAGEERVFLELAIEELRLQLGEVTRRMGELAPQIAVTTEPEYAELRTEALVPSAGGREADPYGMTTKRRPLAMAPAERQEAVKIAERQHAAERAMLAEPEAAVEKAAAEREAAERLAAESAAAEQAAMLERERLRAWPLEERVSPLPAVAEKKPVAAASQAWWMQGPAGGGQRRRALQFGGIAAGLLLATMGIYGSLRSASARADKDGSDKGVSRPVEAAKETTAALATGTAMAAGGKAAPATESKAPQPVAPQFTEPPAVGSRQTGPRVAAEMAAADAPVKAPAERKVVATTISPEVTAKNRRDDAAVEMALAERPKSGKFLFVPAEVMEKHLLSARKPVLPATAQGGATGTGRVVLNAFIAKDGTVSRTDVVEGPAALINSAMAAVSWRRYRPFLVRGQPAAVVTPVVVSYGAAAR